MKRFFVRYFGLLLLLPVFLFSCAGTPEPIQDDYFFPEAVEPVEEDIVLPEEVEPKEELISEVEPIKPEETEVTEIPQPKRLVLTFGGDIMAHTPNFSIKDYSLIYKDIEEILQNDDLSFANLETPVHSGRPYENYPTFNVQPPYVQAAIDAGFQVFSLANNHTNDQGLEGMEETLSYFQSKESEGIYAAGIKKDGQTGITWQLIEKDGWRILFAAITEILNSHNNVNRIDYIAPNSERREQLCKELEEIRQENPCDLFVLSVHTCEDEYVHAITDLRRRLYRSFIKSGVDIVWANHPHLAKEWEIFIDDTENVENGNIEAIAMYALGNTISGQRTNPQFNKPETNRDYTGDGYLIQVVLERLLPQENELHVIEDTNPIPEKNFRIVSVSPYLITTYIDPQGQYIIKQLNETFIQSLKDEGRTTWANYLAERKKLMEKINAKYVHIDSLK